MTEDTSSAVGRWQLATTLRQLREEAELTHDQVIAELKKGQGKWTRPKLSKIENQQQPAKPREVEQLLDVYGAKDKALRGWLLELASASTSPNSSTASSSGRPRSSPTASSRHCWCPASSRPRSTPAH